LGGSFYHQGGRAVGSGTNNLPLDPRDISRTQLHIKNCVFVTFRLVIAKAEARATALRFVEGSRGQTRGMPLRTLRLNDQAVGRQQAQCRLQPVVVREPHHALTLPILR